jgi:N-carbamoylputrescine amidase
VAKAEAMVREAAAKGAHIVLLQELFETLYFPQEQNPKWLGLAKERSQHPLLARMATLARELRVVLPVSFFEKCGQVRFNSVVVLDADGTELGVYRKSHIPDGPGYTEKFYFSPGAAPIA